MATEYVTNVVVSHHNTWTLIKHVAGTINKTAPIKSFDTNSFGWENRTPLDKTP